MGLLVNGEWKDQWYDTSKDGRFQRSESAFRNWVTADGEAGESGQGGFKAESGRYHLYVSLACPWAHRTLILRQLKGLAEHISVSVVHPHMLENGWQFGGDFDTPDDLPLGDTLFGSDYMHQIYTRAMPDYSGRVTVPVLWDKHRNTIVSNESSEIIRMFNSAFNAVTGNNADFYPEPLRQQVDELNERVYHNVNNGVYKAGFATTQSAYEEGVMPLFETLDWLEERLQNNGPYLLGAEQTEADWRLFTTLYRFDPVYVGHFKCNLKRIADYPALSAYMQRLLAEPGVAETCDLGHIKEHYYYSHTSINPYRIVPLGPA
ncbi:MAG: glutathione S-transferase family protein [Gammaproteobacteria bacterium]|nr:glutathione S-transferase family protein [Gammaproteobacteria bacterium]